MSIRRLCFFITIVIVMVCMGGIAQAGTILSFDGNGILGPIIGGTDCPTPTTTGCDPLVINGQSFSFTGTISDPLPPMPLAVARREFRSATPFRLETWGVKSGTRNLLRPLPRLLCRSLFRGGAPTMSCRSISKRKRHRRLQPYSNWHPIALTPVC